MRTWSANGSSRLIWDERPLTFEDVAALHTVCDSPKPCIRGRVMPPTKSIANVPSMDGLRSAIAGQPSCTGAGTAARSTGSIRPTQGGRPQQELFGPSLEKSQYQRHLARSRRISVPRRSDLGSRRSRERRISRANGKRTPDQGRRQMALATEGSRPNHLWDAEWMNVVAAVMLKLIGREFVPPGDTAADGGEIVEPKPQS